MRIALASFLLIGNASAAAPSAASIEIAGDGIFTESLTSLHDGTVIVGSEKRTVYRARPGETTATPWIELPADSPRSVYGVFAHEPSQTLWVCTGTIGETAAPPPPGTLYAFELASGALRAAYPLPNADAICNDIAVGDDGSVYATDTPNMLVVRLAPGATRLEVWASEGFGRKGDVLDGIAVLGDRVIVNTLLTGKLFAVEVRKDGAAGTVTPLALSEPITRPDGMRTIGANRILLGESVAKGRVLLVDVDVDGDRAKVAPVEVALANGAVAVTASGGRAWALDPTIREDGKLRRFRAVELKGADLSVL